MASGYGIRGGLLSRHSSEVTLLVVRVARLLNCMQCHALFAALCTQVQLDLQQAVEVDNEEATDNLRNQLAAYCEVGAVVATPGQSCGNLDGAPQPRPQMDDGRRSVLGL